MVVVMQPFVSVKPLCLVNSLLQNNGGGTWTCSGDLRWRGDVGLLLLVLGVHGETVGHGGRLGGVVVMVMYGVVSMGCDDGQGLKSDQCLSECPASSLSLSLKAEECQPYIDQTAVSSTLCLTSSLAIPAPGPSHPSSSCCHPERLQRTKHLTRAPKGMLGVAPMPDCLWESIVFRIIGRKRAKDGG